MRYTLVAFNARYIHSCPALFSVRNVLKRHLPECETHLRQFTINDPYYETLLSLTGSNADGFFFSVYIWNAAHVARLVCDLTNLLPGRPIILGGPQVSHGIAEDWPPQVTIIRGEAEGLKEEFFGDLSHGRLKHEYSAAPSPSFPSPYLEEDFDIHLKKRHVYYESIRGCPFSCSYCLSSTEKGVRQKDIGLVQEELNLILAHRPRSLRFVDRTFNADCGRALALWRFLAEHGGDTRCHFEIAPDIFDEEIFAFLATLAPGCFEFEIGLQTTNRASLTAVNRAMDLETAKANIIRLVALDTVHLHLDLILGLPFETENSFQESFNTVFSLGSHYIQMGLLKVLPGTGIAQKKEDFGLLSSRTPPYSILATRWLPHDSLRRLFWFGECVEAFYNNRFFQTFFRYIRKNEPNGFAFFASLLDHCQKADFFALSPTQEFMNRILCTFVGKRPDRDLLLEILRYDWLHSGHRFLPDCLEVEEPLQKTKDFLWKRLPQSLEPYYNYASRNMFFKRGTFAGFSSRALAEIRTSKDEVDGHEGFIAFLPDREDTILRNHKTVCFSRKMVSHHRGL